MSQAMIKMTKGKLTQLHAYMCNTHVNLFYVTMSSSQKVKPQKGMRLKIILMVYKKVFGELIISISIITLCTVGKMMMR